MGPVWESISLNWIVDITSKKDDNEEIVVGEVWEFAFESRSTIATRNREGREERDCNITVLKRGRMCVCGSL